MGTETRSSDRWRVVFFGTPEFAIPSLSALIDHPHFDITLVVTQPDRPAGRHRRLTQPPIKTFALAHDLPVYQPESLRGAAHRAPLIDAQADLFVVAAFGLIFGERTLAIPSLGCVNVHASLLPKYRGAAPIAAAILTGEEETGVSLMKMDRGLDTGPVIAMARTSIRATDTTETLTAHLGTVGADLLAARLPEFASGALPPEQQLDSGASLVRPLLKADGWLDWSLPAVALERQVRAMWPWPRAWTTLNGQIMQIHQASIVTHSHDAGFGTVISHGSDVLVACGNGALRLDRVQLAGGRPVPGKALLSGRHITTSIRLGISGAPPPPPPLIRLLDNDASRGEKGDR